MSHPTWSAAEVLVAALFGSATAAEGAQRSALRTGEKFATIVLGLISLPLYVCVEALDAVLWLCEGGRSRHSGDQDDGSGGLGGLLTRALLALLYAVLHLGNEDDDD